MDMFILSYQFNLFFNKGSRASVETNFPTESHRMRYE